MNIINTELPNGWYWASNEESNELFIELQKELHPLHMLKNAKLKVVAHRKGASDDILCELLDNPGLYHMVHLSWIGKQEIDFNHPNIVFSGNLPGLFEYEKMFSVDKKCAQQGDAPERASPAR